MYVLLQPFDCVLCQIPKRFLGKFFSKFRANALKIDKRTGKYTRAGLPNYAGHRERQLTPCSDLFVQHFIRQSDFVRRTVCIVSGFSRQ